MKLTTGIARTISDRAKIMENPVGLKPFRLMVDLRAAGWSEERIETARAVTVLIDETVERVAYEKLAISDHIYSFGTWCEHSGGT